MIRQFFIAMFLLMLVASLDLNAMNRNKKDRRIMPRDHVITMNKNNNNIDDGDCCENVACLYFPLACGVLRICTAIATENLVAGAASPSEIASNLFVESITCATIGMAAGGIAHCGYQCCKKIKKD